MPSGVGEPKTAPSWHVDCGVYTLELLQLRSWLHWSWFLRLAGMKSPIFDTHSAHSHSHVTKNMNHQYNLCIYYDVSNMEKQLKLVDPAAYMISMQQETYRWSHALPMFACQVTKALSMALRAMAAGLKGDGRSQGRWFCWSRPPASRWWSGDPFAKLLYSLHRDGGMAV